MPRTVLVVDDSPIDRITVGGLLSDLPDMEVVFADSVASAREQLRLHRPDLLITDLIMPDEDGLDLVALMVRDHPLVPVILVTGRGSELTAVRALQAGAANYVPKGVLAERLCETVENVLAASREEQSKLRLMEFHVRSEFEFELDNDATNIPPLINHIHRSVRMVGLCEEGEAIRICVAVEEAVTNAVFHGNLELSSQLREVDSGAYRRAIEERRRATPYRDRKVQVRATLSRAQGEFVIRDEGPGFDPHDLPDPTLPENIEKCSGRGLLLMRTFMDEVEYNSQGNEVRLLKLGRGEQGRHDDPHGKDHGRAPLF